MVCYLVGIETEKQYSQGPMAGAIFENYVIAELIKKEKNKAGHAQFYYYRTNNRQEIDLIVDRKSVAVWYEIKKNNTFNPKMTKQLEQIVTSINDPLKQHHACLLYGGESFEYKDNVAVKRYSELLDE